MEVEIKKKKEHKKHLKEEEELVKKIESEKNNTHNFDSLIGKAKKNGEKLKKEA